MINDHKERYFNIYLIIDLNYLWVSECSSILYQQVVIPLSLQRRVEGLLQEHLDRSQLTLHQNCNDTEVKSVSDHPEGVISDGREGSLVDRSIMEKILQRTSLRMRNLQRTWQVQLTTVF